MTSLTTYYQASVKYTIALMLTTMLGLSLAATTQAQNSIEKAQDDPEGALIFVDELSNNALAVLDDMSMTQDERDQAFRELLREGFDLDYIGKLTLGRHWRSADSRQKQEFNSIFPEYVLRIYSNRLRERGDETFEILSSVPAGKKDVYVRSEIVRTDGPAIAADWRVRYKNDAFRIVDLKIEGISMVLTQRDEFSSRINAVGFDGLLTEIRDKTDMDKEESSSQTDNAGQADNTGQAGNTGQADNTG